MRLIDLKCFDLKSMRFQFSPQDNVEEWLTKHGLAEYWPTFNENSYTEPRDLADIKYMSSDVITNMFGIVKKAHLRKLKELTSVLQYPTKGEGGTQNYHTSRSILGRYWLLSCINSPSDIVLTFYIRTFSFFGSSTTIDTWSSEGRDGRTNEKYENRQRWRRSWKRVLGRTSKYMSASRASCI